MGNTPNIRFKGFDDDWEQRKFVSVFEGLQNNTLSRADLNYENGTVKNVHYGDVLIKFGDYIDASRTDLPYISDDAKAEKFKNSFLQDGDIIIADTAEDDTVGKCTEIQGSEGLKLLSGLHTVACRPKEKYGPMFLGYYINSPAYHNQLKPLMQGIKVTSISKSALQDTDMIMPKSIEEQTMIGGYFANLDSLITLHQRKCNETKELKKFMLQKMFPKKNEKKPEIRFAGFDDDWEQRKLGEIANKVTKKNQDAVVTEVFTNSAEFGIISQRDFFDKDIANAENINSYYVVEPDDFVYNSRISTTAPFGPIKRNKLEKTGAMSPLYYVFKPHDIDLTYLEGFFQTTRWHAFMKFNGNSGARSDRFAITDKIFNKMPISMPQDIDEQRMIGMFLTELDHLITLHQRKCDEAKEMKKFMLQNMFPKKG